MKQYVLKQTVALFVLLSFVGSLSACGGSQNQFSKVDFERWKQCFLSKGASIFVDQIAVLC